MSIEFELPKLPYGKADLLPFITEETFDYHYGKHHQAYVNNLVQLTKDTPKSELSIEQIILESNKSGDASLFNNAAQHWNHSFFWNCMSPNGGKTPIGKISELITRDFGSIEKFKELFSNAALKHFGSGWAWLAQTPDGKLEITALKDANTPIAHSYT